MVRTPTCIGETVIDTVKDTIISFLKAFYSEQEKFTYREDPKESELAIMDRFTYNLDEKNHGIALVVTRGRMNFQASSWNRIMEQTPEGHKKIKSDLMTGSFIVSAYSREGIEAEILACRTFGAIIAHQDKLKQIGGLHSVGMTMAAVGEETVVASDTKSELVEVPIILDFAKQYSIYIDSREGQPLETVNVEVNTPTP